MSVEMACGNCQGRFLAAAPGTVACPHCGVHLLISPESFPAGAADVEPPAVEVRAPAQVEPEFPSYASMSEAVESPPQEFEPVGSAVALPVSPQDQSEPADVAEAVPVPDEAVALQSAAAGNGSSFEPAGAPAAGDSTPDFSKFSFSEPADETPDEGTSFDFESEGPTLSLNDAGQPAPDAADDDAPTALFERNESPFAPAEAAAEEFPDFGSPAEEEAEGIDAVLAAASNEATITSDRPQMPAAPPPSPAPLPAAAKPGAGGPPPVVPRSWFMLLASYASAMTIVALWLLFESMTGSHQLENLEDPADPPREGKQKSVRLYQIESQLPRGHMLALGESRRFGNIVVEPIKVTRGPLNFAHFSHEKGGNKEATPPVLKLWLRFENRSSDQQIAPLDSLLLYENRVPNQDDFELRGNTFVSRAEQMKKGGNVVYVYRLNTNDVWDLAGQELKKLGPGESLITYVPSSTEGIGQLTGDLVWRVHFRKGYSRSGRGLTTLLEVNFHSDDILPEGSRPAGQATTWEGEAEPTWDGEAPAQRSYVRSGLCIGQELWVRIERQTSSCDAMHRSRGGEAAASRQEKYVRMFPMRTEVPWEPQVQAVNWIPSLIRRSRICSRIGERTSWIRSTRGSAGASPSQSRLRPPRPLVALLPPTLLTHTHFTEERSGTYAISAGDVSRGLKSTLRSFA